MERMFEMATLFNQDISGWDVSSVTKMPFMFKGAIAFNQPIGNWDVSSVTTMQEMFSNKYPKSSNLIFNQPIGNWDVSKVTNISKMFQYATAFNQDLSKWDISSITTATNFLPDAFTTENYDKLLVGWATLSSEENQIPSGISISFGTTKYSGGAPETSRDILTSSPYSWSISDGEQVPNANPSDILISSNTISENNTSGDTIGALTTTDIDVGDAHSYTLTDTANYPENSNFSISGANLQAAAVFDYETKTSYAILLQTTDAAGATYTKTFTISVIDVDEDADGDGIANSADNCPTTANADQLDTDTDGIGDVCDSDDDGDGVLDTADAFPLDATETTDTDGDQIGDNTDTDDDNDGFTDSIEVSCGTDPIDSSSSPTDTDADGDPDCLDTDDDNDTYLDTQDAFPLDATEWLDTDGDQIGDNTDTDDDNDNYLDTDEIACESDPLDSSSLPLDYDQDLSPDCIDDNDDNDICLDTEDNFPLNKDLCVDTDADGIDDRFEIDKDNDGVRDNEDAFPFDPNESVDTDGDGIGNNEDQDDNNDGFSDVGLIISKVLTPNETGVESTWKVINIDQYPNTQVKVYAPDGSLVYESNNYQNDWAGTNISNGNPLPTGSYYFKISAAIDSDKPQDGWLYIFN